MIQYSLANLINEYSIIGLSAVILISASLISRFVVR